ncbi:MAG: 23S rRNA (pseudouridine(1915)-N(3))-methyltransferase RlmH [Bacteroidales bacterium]|nr:23S rRNA (pseudouridine(1915)-N(3))-methyltransferase RlmH [Bacteroidales bacterium]MBN2757352.1 23S rRNA (pseudouridine(1915)-N(3))-methyltransferase RlmH [Bacteroidales bacterium]
MKIKLIFTGKSSFKYIIEGVDIYEKRIKHFTDFEIITIPDLKNTKNLKAEQIKQKEAELILKNITKNDFLILLDEKGKEFSSIEFSEFIEQKNNIGIKQVCFVIGGAYGFSNDVYNRSNLLLSLSKMTYSHQIIRLFFVEQLYRAFTIINRIPYHNE